MAIAALHNIVQEFDKLTLLRGLSLEISRGERVALVGANGSGKTTVFRILTRQMPPTQGKVFWAKGLRAAYLPQQPKLEGDQTVRQAARQGFSELVGLERGMRELSAEMATAGGERLGKLMGEYSRLESAHMAGGGFAWEHRVEEVLAGVGFLPAERDKPCRVLSGGQQGRLALACTLLAGADLLLLDEPTNHLDLEAVQWLEKYLAKLPAAVLLVSHDRYLLDRVVSKVYELYAGKTEMYPGNYTSYVKERENRRLNLRRQFQKDQEYIAKERDFIARFHASGSRSREARGRWTRLERQLKAGEFLTEAPRDGRRLALRIEAAGRGSELAVRLEGVGKSFGEEELVRDLTLDLEWGQKLAVLGPNGVGKTTLLRMMLGQERQDCGTIKVGKGMSIGYYDQRQTGLDESLTVLGQMSAFTGSADQATLRGFLARFLFTGDDVFKAVAALSGGERSRLLLARLLYQRPNFLVLDEPTNHLDIAAREVLEEALCEYEGTVLLVSHDRYFVDRVCGRVLLLWRGRWELVEGNYSHWQMLQEEKAATAAAEGGGGEGVQEGPGSKGSAARTQKGKPGRTSGGQAGAGKTRAAARDGSAARVGGMNTYQLGKLSLVEVEERIHRAERRLNEVEQSFADPVVFSDMGKWQAAQTEHEQLRAEIGGLMEVWQVKMEE